MKTISVIWVIFALLFSFLAAMSFKQAARNISKFNLPERPMKNATVLIKGMDIDQPLREFASNFDNYIETYNRASGKQNRIAGWGYIAAALVSLASFFLEIFRG